MYQMPVRAIKNILLKEHVGFMDESRRNQAFYDYSRYILNVADESIIARIDACETYEQLNEFIGESRGMNLLEWIESL